MTDEFRISSWDEFIGQTKMKARFQTHITAAKRRGEQLPPILLAGEPGYGKTTMAHLIAAEMEQPVTEAQMPLNETALVRLVEDCDGVLFLDEVHAASKEAMEMLQPLLLSGYIENRRGVRTDAWPTLSIIAATTEPEKLLAPFRERFLIKPPFDPYTDEEMGLVVTGMARMAGVKLTKATAEQLGRATGGTPRSAAEYVLAAKDLKENLKRTPTAIEILTMCRVDETGVSHQHRQYLASLGEAGGVAGLTTLRTLLRLPESVVRDLEPLLLRQKLIRLSPSGRELTGAGQRKIKEA